MKTPREVQAKLTEVIAYTNTEKPSREKIATDLRALADAVEQGRTASTGQDILYYIIPQDDISSMYERLMDEDDQAADLFKDTIQKIQKNLDLDTGSAEALNRLRDITSRGQRWDIALLRNNIFKAANALGLKLPSGMF